MKAYIFFLVFLLSLSTSALSEVYVSKDGSDTNDGSFSNPFKTIQKASDLMPAGGTCYIREGVYRETVTVNKENQKFINYNNEYVLVTGLDIVEGWSEYKEGIYQAPFTFSELQFTQLFVNGQYQQMARYPDNTTGKMMDVSYESGYDIAEAFNQVASETTRKVTFPNMPDVPDNFWAGGYYRGITGKTWMNPHGIIQSNSDNDLSVTPGLKQWEDNQAFILGGGEGFIFHLNALDYPGEWYAQNDKVYYLPKSYEDINSIQIEAQKRQWAFKTTKNGLTLKGIHIKAASLEIKASNCIIDNCTVRYLFPYFTRRSYGTSYTQMGGVYINGNNNKLTNCYIAHSWGNGISLESGDANSFDNCFIEDVGWDPQFTTALLTHAENTNIKNCTFGSAGRFHIRFENKTDILYCDLYDCMKMGQDAGSIESVTLTDTEARDLKDTEIAYNTIHDCTTLSAYSSTKNFVVALYIEDSYNYTAHHNLIWNIRSEHQQGAFAYLGPRRTTISNVKYYNNTVWDCDKGICIWNRDKMGNVLDTKFYNNLLDSRMVDDADDIAVFPEIKFSNNVYSNSANDHFTDYSNQDFTLKASSVAIDAGMEITGITDGYTGSAPDAGAFEYGKTKWTSGANLTVPEFKEIIYQEYVIIKANDLNMEVNDTLEYTIEVSENIDPNTLQLSSDKPSVVKIDDKGNIIGISEGSALITISTPDHQYAHYITIHVTNTDSSIYDYNNKSFIVHPSPVSNELYVSSTMPVDKLSLLSLSGDFLKETTGNKMNTKGLNSGIYVLMIESDDKLITKKILKK